jgi:hypothetical protein
LLIHDFSCPSIIPEHQSFALLHLKLEFEMKHDKSNFASGG